MHSTQRSRVVQRRRRTRRRIAAGGGILVVLLMIAAVWHNNTVTPKVSRTAKTDSHANPGNHSGHAELNKPGAKTATGSQPATTPGYTPLPASKLLTVAPQSQLPQLPNGCEVTSLSMLLSAVGHPINKMTLAAEEPKDPTKREYGPGGKTIFWGNPNVGFVGSVYQYANGFGIYHGPITKFINQLLPGRGEDLTGKPFTDILAVVAHGTPVILWTTATFQPTNQWTSWNTPEGPIKVTVEEHAVLLVGYNHNQLFINNPLNGEQAQPVNRQQFLAAWKQLGNQAVTILPASTTP